jgi:hypothetical protein
MRIKQEQKMRRVLLTIAAVLFGTAAQASGATTAGTIIPAVSRLFCHAPRLLVSSGRPHPDPIITSDIGYNGKQWQVLHHLASGAVMMRSEQVRMIDDSHNGALQWSGFMLANPALLMKGVTWVHPLTGERGYDEWIFDTANGNRVEMHSTALCRIVLSPADGDGDIGY